MADTDKKSNYPLMYKDKPLVRSGKQVYYGDMADEYIIMAQVVESTPFKDIEQSGKVSVQLMKTDPTLSLGERIIKKSEKNGLFNALDIGAIWLEKALRDVK